MTPAESLSCLTSGSKFIMWIITYSLSHFLCWTVQLPWSSRDNFWEQIHRFFLGHSKKLDAGKMLLQFEQHPFFLFVICVFNWWLKLNDKTSCFPMPSRTTHGSNLWPRCRCHFKDRPVFLALQQSVSFPLTVVSAARLSSTNFWCGSTSPAQSCCNTPHQTKEVLQ